MINSKIQLIIHIAESMMYATHVLGCNVLNEFVIIRQCEQIIIMFLLYSLPLKERHPI